MGQNYWRFERTGWSTYFVLDTLLQVIAILFCWIVLGIAKCRYKKHPYHKNVGRAYTIFHKIHEISILYVTISLILEWVFSSGTSGLRWGSFFVSCVLMIYFLVYTLHMYYDLFQYPSAHINTRSYLYYATKYGSFLSHIRF